MASSRRRFEAQLKPNTLGEPPDRRMGEVVVDFERLRKKQPRGAVIEPTEIFRRLPKPPGINDLYTSQDQVLEQWFVARDNRDTVVKLHTGGGKTLVGLLIAQSTLNETGEGVLYLVPTTQLVSQTLEKARDLGIRAVPYGRQQPLNDEFANGRAIMVATYKALFNGRSRFGVRGVASPHAVSAVILDDAHAAFSVVRDSFTLEVSAANKRELYEGLTAMFRKYFKDVDRLGTFDDVCFGLDFSVLEVPYWGWHDRLDAVRELLKAEAETYPLVWPLLRDQLHLCHALVSQRNFTITPVLPLVDQFPTFSDAPRRVYMSATIADDSEIVRTFDADPQAVCSPLTSRSLAGISERMLLIPDLMPFQFDVREALEKLLEWTAKQRLGAVVLAPSDRAATEWSGVAEVAQGSSEVSALVTQLQGGTYFGPVVFSNRYDGIDLPGDTCRLLVMSGLPAGTSSYELFRASTLFGGATVTRMLAQRIEQGSGRGSRGSGDHCVVVLAGADLAAWVAKEANFQFLTSATRAQLEMGAEISREIKDLQDLASTIKRSFDRDAVWTEYHAETLADLVTEDRADESRLAQAAGERKAFNLWCDGHPDKAIARIERLLTDTASIDDQTRGWLHQTAARIAHKWGAGDRAEEMQQRAYSENRNLLKPRVRPPYAPLALPGEQAGAIARMVGEYRFRRGLLQSFETAVSQLHGTATANQFEQAMVDLARYMGLAAERHDDNGEGPDVLWLMPGKTGLVIEAKSRKKRGNALTKKEHGQLLVAAEWFAANYPGYECVRVCVHPNRQVTQAAGAYATYALTPEHLARMVEDARSLLTTLCESQVADSELETLCAQLLEKSPIGHDGIVEEYFVLFEGTPQLGEAHGRSSNPRIT